MPLILRFAACPWPAQSMLLAVCLILTGCPEEQPKKSAPAGGDKHTEEDIAASVKEQQEGEAATEAAKEIEAPPNPKPAGDDWVWPELTLCKVGQELRFEYATKAAPESAIVVLVRSEIDPAVWQPAQLLAEQHYQPDPQDGGKGSLLATDDGRWRLVLFADRNDPTSILDEGNELLITEWPRGGNDSSVKPYITIGEPTVGGEIAFNPGQAVIGYFELEEAYTPSAWIGLIPADTDNAMDLYNDKLAVEKQPIGTSVKDAPLFVLEKPGRYVLRIFPSDLDGCEWTLQSEPFSVVEK